MADHKAAKVYADDCKADSYEVPAEVQNLAAAYLELADQQQQHEPGAWNAYDNAGMRYPEEGDLTGGETDTPSPTAQEQRESGQPFCPVCYTFGRQHRKDCRYAQDGMAHHVRAAQDAKTNPPIKVGDCMQPAGYAAHRK